jgi:hypothetical protein
MRAVVNLAEYWAEGAAGSDCVWSGWGTVWGWGVWLQLVAAVCERGCNRLVAACLEGCGVGTDVIGRLCARLSGWLCLRELAEELMV